MLESCLAGHQGVRHFKVLRPMPGRMIGVLPAILFRYGGLDLARA